MTNNNNFPLYAEEITLNQTTEQIQEIFNKFQQPTSTNFIELGQPKKYWGSTEGWKEPVCERYSFKYDNKSITLDITQELNNKLELNPEKNFYVARELLNQDEKEEVIITIKNEEQIFIKRPLTINNLVSTLQKWLTEFNNLKENFAKLENGRDEYQTKWDNSLEDLEQKRKIIQNYSQQIEELKKEKEQLSKQLTVANTSINNAQNQLGINNLNNLPKLLEGETLDSLLRRPTSADLEYKQVKINSLEKEKEELRRKEIDSSRELIYLSNLQKKMSNLEKIYEKQETVHAEIEFINLDLETTRSLTVEEEKIPKHLIKYENVTTESLINKESLIRLRNAWSEIKKEIKG